MAFEDFNPGKLNKRISIVSFHTATSQDDFGFAADDKEDEPEVEMTCWAMVSDETGTKAAESGTEFATARRRFFIRYTSKPITTDMMVSYNGDYYAIVRPPCTYGDSKRYIEIWTEKKRRE